MIWAKQQELQQAATSSLLLSQSWIALSCCWQTDHFARQHGTDLYQKTKTKMNTKIWSLLTDLLWKNGEKNKKTVIFSRMTFIHLNKALCIERHRCWIPCKFSLLSDTERRSKAHCIINETMEHNACILHYNQTSQIESITPQRRWSHKLLYLQREAYFSEPFCLFVCFLKVIYESPPMSSFN